MLNKDQILEALDQVCDPELNRSLSDLKMVREVRLEGNKVNVTVALTMPNCPLKDKIKADVVEAIEKLAVNTLHQAIQSAEEAHVNKAG